MLFKHKDLFYFIQKDVIDFFVTANIGSPYLVFQGQFLSSPHPMSRVTQLHSAACVLAQLSSMAVWRSRWSEAFVNPKPQRLRDPNNTPVLLF